MPSAPSRKHLGIRAPLHPLQLRCASSPYSPGTPSLARLAGAAHRRSRCVKLFARRYTSRHRSARGAPGGFTLLELVAAVAILALIAGSVAVGIRLASASIGRGEAVAREAARLRAAVGILERAIRSLDPMPLPAEGETAVYFSGEGKKLRFLTAMAPSTFSGGGMRLISFFELSGGNGGLAVATAPPFRPEGAGSWEGTEGARILVPGATEVAFTYSEGPAKDGTWEWLPAWEPKEPGALPAAVRIEFSAPGEDGPRKNAYVVPVPAGGGFGG